MRRKFASASGSTGVGCVVRISTVSSSTLRAPLTLGSADLYAESGSSPRFTLKTTSSAVKGVPSWNFTPGRSWKRQPLPPSSGVHDSASRGPGRKLSSRSTSDS